MPKKFKPVLVDEKTHADLKKFCEKKGLVMSRFVRDLIARKITNESSK